MRVYTFKLTPSKQYILLIIIVLFLSEWILIDTPLKCLEKGIGLLLLSGYGFYFLRRFGFLLDKNSILKITQCTNGQWLLHAKQTVYQASLRGDSTVSTKISILRFD